MTGGAARLNSGRCRRRAARGRSSGPGGGGAGLGGMSTSSMLNSRVAPGMIVGSAPRSPYARLDWTDHAALAAHLHELQGFGPAGDHPADVQCHRLAAMLRRTVEHRAIDELTLVVDAHAIAVRPESTPCLRSLGMYTSPVDGLLRAGQRRGLIEIGLSSSLLALIDRSDVACVAGPAPWYCRHRRRRLGDD